MTDPRGRSSPGSLVNRQCLRRALATLPATNDGLDDVLRHVLDDGMARLRDHLEGGASGIALVTAMSRLIDTVLKELFAHVLKGESGSDHDRMALVAVGGYGRGELAPHSDLDLLFLLAGPVTTRQETVISRVLYCLWDLGLKVGHATRTLDEAIECARDDMTIRTAVLEARLLAGDRSLFRTFRRRFQRSVVTGSDAAFVRAKLEERDRRHLKTGDSRYVLEPDVKEGKGGLRDLHVLVWIARYLYPIARIEDLVPRGVLSRAELSRFRRAADFLNRVRCHLHFLSGRAEERLTFDLQTDIARRMGFSDARNQRAVERFMKRYFLATREVGGLSRIFAAVIAEQHGGQPRSRYVSDAAEIDGFPVSGGMISIRNRRHFEESPGDLVRMFHVSQDRRIDIHPRALWLMTQSLARIDDRLRHDALDNSLFMDILTAMDDPLGTLQAMNEAGVMGRFLPDFGRVVAQMQHDMYHVYTVDEHSIRAVGILAAIERGEIADELPLATGVFPLIMQRRVLYLAVLLHDIAKGRGGDHSVLGAGVADHLAPRLGFTAEETETVSWLVRHHLIMSNTAFRRDLEEPRTIDGFAGIVQSIERLRLLLVLTVADIRAVGPRVWNNWKGDLLRELYYRAEEVISGGHGAAIAKKARVEARMDRLREALEDWQPVMIDNHIARLVTPYWLAFDSAAHVRHAELMRHGLNGDMTVATEIDDARDITEVTVFAPDRPGLFAEIAGAIAVAGASIVDARIFTTLDGMALDAFRVQDEHQSAFRDKRRLERLRDTIRRTLAGDLDLAGEINRRRKGWHNGPDLAVLPRVLVDNRVSTRHTFVEITARDRRGLLSDLAHAVAELHLSIVTARVATFGERAVDAFYLCDGDGGKITSETELDSLRHHLIRTIEADEPAPATVH